MKLAFYVAIAAAITAFYNKESLTGKWESQPSKNGNVSGVVFRPDNTYTAYVNQKPFGSGVYTLQDSILTIKEPACEFIGTYKTIFFSSGDSLKLQAVNDSCTERAKGISRLVFGRVK